MKLLLLLTLFLCFQNAFTQTYCRLIYTYDGAGNRIQRAVTSSCDDSGDGDGGDTRMLLTDSCSNNQNLTANMFPNPTSGPFSIVFNNAVEMLLKCD